MSITPERIRHLASLARLRLTPEEQERMARELDEIVGHLEALAGAEEAAGPRPDPGSEPGPAAPLRDDRVDPLPLLLPPAELAPAWRDGLFVVPRLAGMDAPAEPGGNG